MDSKAIAIVIIGVSIFTLVVSSTIGNPPDETPYFFQVSAATAQTLVNPVASVAGAGGSARFLTAADSGHGDGNLVCPSATGGNPVAVTVLDLSSCTFVWRNGPSAGWRCEGKLVRDCVGDILLNTTGPSDSRFPSDVIGPPA